jgi:hypothetical protein
VPAKCADDFDFAKDDPQNETVVVIDEEEKLSSLSANMLKLHHQFNPISFGKIRALARAGTVDPRMANVPSQCCSACLYGKATRRAWRFKPTRAPQRMFFSVSQLGQVVSIDMRPNLTRSLITHPRTALTNQSASLRARQSCGFCVCQLQHAIQGKFRDMSEQTRNLFEQTRNLFAPSVPVIM